MIFSPPSMIGVAAFAPASAVNRAVLAVPALAAWVFAAVSFVSLPQPAGAQVAAKAAKAEKGDEAVLAARDALRAGNAVQLARAAQAARGHVLEPYVEYWQLRHRLDDRAPEEIREFLKRREGSYSAERMRIDWLKSLAKKGQWELFREERPKLVIDDEDIVCLGLLQRLNAGDASALAEVKPVWLMPKELPEGCAPLADQLIRSGQFGTEQIWERFRVLADAGQINAGKRLLGALAPREQPAAGAVDRIVAAPAKYLLQLSEVGRSRAAREMTIFALMRVARNDPVEAAARWNEALRGGLPAEDQAYGWGQVALWGARRHMPEAVGWFARAEGAALNDEQLAWRVRIALRNGAWSEVQKAIERMSVEARRDATWVYWRGRALREAGNVAEARAEFEKIIGEFNFYGQMAAEELGQAFKLPAAAASSTTDELTRAAATPGLQRAMALFRLDLRFEAVREWNWTLRGMDDRQLIAAAEIAKRNEIWDRAINTADRTVVQHDFGLRYLAPYQQALGGQARAQQLEEHWVMGLVRQESRFIANAKSSAGAAGLMQLMPATARWVANKMGMKDFHWSRVTAVDVNAALGSYYLRTVLNELDGHPVLASAAYNAGPGRARRWQDAKPLEGAIYAESIPFNETRDYVKKVMTNALYYAAVHGGKHISLRERMGTVGARGGARSNDIP